MTRLPSLLPTRILPFVFSTLFFLSSIAVSAQPIPGVINFLSARQYDDYEGTARIALVRELEKNDWYVIDSIYEWREEGDKTPLRTTKRDLSPFVNDEGEMVHWVSDVAPQFPGGRKGIQQYMRDVVGPVVSGPDDEVQNSVYIRCTIGPDGSVGEVAEAQKHAQWVPVEIIAQCLDAVRYMLAWSPGVFRDKPVQVCVLVEVALKE